MCTCLFIAHEMRLMSCLAYRDLGKSRVKFVGVSSNKLSYSYNVLKSMSIIPHTLGKQNSLTCLQATHVLDGSCKLNKVIQNCGC